MATQPVIISGTCHYASIVEPNTTFEPVWSIDVTLDDANKAIVENHGLTVKNKDDDRGNFVTIKRKVMKKDGSKRPAPSVLDSQNNSWDGKLVGNGSKVNVKFLPYEWQYAGKAGTSADLLAVQVTDLVEYNKEDFEAVDGGYTVATEKDDIPF